MQFNRELINSAVLGLLIWFLRRDLTLALTITVASYVLPMVTAL